ncbi:Sas10 C-terminal domain-containing protein [Plectosphaerella plurivora]|uniref:Sas10 C-terminal domain-containing protein n=1 Tax=Plectosphaerella plurivora TaxID=936078 RepID=A0A9P8V1V8_9PEZI|nr:Sas10 C-terminal domain-containing protein [Plectosphaerella plurivora]
MVKKRKVSSRNAQSADPTDINPADARLGPINTYEDVADSEEEYFLNRDKILFEEEPHSKRRKRQQEEDDFLEMSDEEILDGNIDSSDEEQVPTKKRAHATDRSGNSDDDNNAAEEDGDAEDGGWWGDSKEDYYNADQAETEADALGEEAEAKRMQRKKLAKMSEEDFIFQESDWHTTNAADDEINDIVTEVLQDVQLTEDMTPAERSKLLHSRYPEFEHLVHEFQELQPTLVALQKQATGKDGKSIEAVKYWVLGCYVAALASYFGILTSPSRDASTIRNILSPSDLRDHEVMETLVTCRTAWQRISGVRSTRSVHETVDPSHALTASKVAQLDPKHAILSKSEKKQKKLREKTQKAKAKQAMAVEESLADIDNLIKARKPSKTRTVDNHDIDHDEDDNSDFGEEEALDARTAADKAARKKSLRFYTSQIVQKSNRRAGAGRDAGGDMDIPYRERLRDRQARLNAEAERRGHKDSKHGAELGADGDDSGEEDANPRGADEDDEYYDMVASKANKKKAEKAALHQALAAASKSERVVEHEEVGEDGKRKITYAIEKNKGLAPKRKKENRNPRVKKKLQYEAKQKKLRSMKATYKGGEPRGGYGGEMSGISTGVVRARKL